MHEAMRPGFRRILCKPLAAVATLAAFAGALLPFALGQSRAQSNASSGASHDASQTTSADSSAALCPVVYPDDQTPARRGYHYTFFGNAFFINDQGYLLTVAHVLDTFRDGGQPYILVNRPDAPPRLLKVAVVAKDSQHDVAILRATPNPFVGKYNVAFLSLSKEPALLGEDVLALSLRPKRLSDAQSFEFEREDASLGTVLNFESTNLDNSGAAADVFLLSHPVVKGQSGSPVLAVDTHEVVGLVEGLWLRGVSLARSAALPTNVPGAAIPIRYSIALLEQNHVVFRSAQAQ